MSEEAINKRNEMFREVHPAGPTTHEESFVIVGEDIKNDAFKATWGGKTPADVQKENDQTVNALFDQASKENDIGSVFEKREKNVVSDEDFERTYGMTKEEAYERSLDYINKMAEKEKINKEKEIGRVFEKDEKELEKKALTSDNTKSMVETGGVFEKQDKLDEQPRFSETPNKRLDNIDWDAFYDESDTMDPKQPHLSRQPTKFEDVKVYYHDTKDTVTGVKGLDPKDIDDLKKQIDKLEVEKKDGPTMSGPTTHSTFGDLK